MKIGTDILAAALVTLSAFLLLGKIVQSLQMWLKSLEEGGKSDRRGLTKQIRAPIAKKGLQKISFYFEKFIVCVSFIK